MSYILDALRRAEAERERGGVPGLGAQPYNPAHGGGAARRPLPWHWVAVGLAALVLAGVWAGYSLRSEAPHPASAEAPMAASPPAAPAVTAPATAPDTSTQPEAAPAVAAATPRPAYIDAPPPARSTAARAGTPQAAANPTAPLPSASPAQGAAAGAKAATAPTDAKATDAKATPPAAAEAKAAASAPRVYAIAELPDAIRAELPKLSLGGSMYSENASARMVIVNGQVLHEGDRLSNDLQLVGIRLRSAVFAYKGYRYELGY